MTILGGVFLAIFGMVLLLRRKQFIWCVVGAIPFPDSAMFVVGGIGISPYFVALIVFALLSVEPRARSHFESRPRWTLIGALSICFLTYTLLITMIAPNWFAGLLVNSARVIGTNEHGAIFVPLKYSDSNLAQIIYLVLNLLLVAHISRLPPSQRPPDLLFVAFGLAIACALGISALEHLGAYSVHELFDNSPRNFYATKMSEARFRGQFSEPSHLGAFATASAAFALSAARGGKGRRRIWASILFLGSAVVLIGSATGTAMIAIVALGCIHLVISGLRVFRTGRVGLGVILGGPLLAGLALAVGPIWWHALLNSVEAKRQSISYVIRAPQDENSWALVWNSNGLGVGLGSNRSSSLAPMLLSNVGIFGCLLLIAIFLVLVKTCAKLPEMRPVVWALAGFTISAVVSLADFTSPVLWMSLGICFSQYRDELFELRRSAGLSRADLSPVERFQRREGRAQAVNRRSQDGAKPFTNSRNLG